MPNVSSIVILAIIVVAVGLVVRSYVKGAGHGGCCGDAGGAVRLKPPRDGDASHYSHAYSVVVDGMSCDNCARRVANAFNGTDGMYAEVSLADGAALVRTKQPVSAEALQKVVRGAGYGAGAVTEA